MSRWFSVQYRSVPLLIALALALAGLACGCTAPSDSTPNDSTPNDSTPNDSTPNDSTPNDSTSNDSTPNDGGLDSGGDSSADSASDVNRDAGPGERSDVPTRASDSLALDAVPDTEPDAVPDAVADTEPDTAAPDGAIDDAADTHGELADADVTTEDCAAACAHQATCFGWQPPQAAECEIGCGALIASLSATGASALLGCVTSTPCEQLSAGEPIGCLPAVGQATPARAQTCQALDQSMGTCTFSDADAATAAFFCQLAAIDWTEQSFAAVAGCASLPVDSGGSAFPNPPPISESCAIFEVCVGDALGLWPLGWGSEAP